MYKGFTIVELLIVVVVIAILATVTIVSYNGIQQRAKTVAVTSVVDSWEKVVRMVAAQGGQLPPAGCLGRPTDYPVADGFAANVCVTYAGAPAATYDDAGYANWPASVSRPSAKAPVVSFSFEGQPVRARGIWIHSHDTGARSLTVAWLPQVSDQCGRGFSIASSGTGSLSGGYCGLNIGY